MLIEETSSLAITGQGQALENAINGRMNDEGSKYGQLDDSSFAGRETHGNQP